MNSQKTAIWNLGFRPLFLLGTLWALVLIFLWVLVQAGLLHWSFAFDSITWHAHEMLFGFTSAIIAGFILTASQNWAGKPGVHGTPLKLLTFIWLAARIFSLFAQTKLLFTLTDLLFFPALIYLLIPYLGISTQKKNRVFFLLFTILFSANLLIHLDEWDILSAVRRDAYLLAVHTIILIIIVIGGRVIPFFTERAVAKSSPKRIQWLETLTIPTALVFLILEFFIPYHSFTTYFCFTLAGLHFLRWFAWGPWKTLQVPLLWILYVGYLWVPIGFLLYALTGMGYFIPSLATHAFATGAIGILIYAMVSRVTLGHTGRPLRADMWMVLGYILITLTPIFRVFLIYLNPDLMYTAILVSGTTWCLAYLILFARISPMLLQARPDGKAG